MKTSMLGCETRTRAVEDLVDRPCEFQLRAMPPDVKHMCKLCPHHHIISLVT